MLSGETRLVGLIGDPVSHSLSPRMQNAAFAARALDWAYVPLHVGVQALETAVAGLAALDFGGANVTIPYKSAVLAYCDELDAFAERAGSVNTLVVEEGRVVGSSTDGVAVTTSVRAEGARVLLLGAGGAAQAVATALLDAGAESVTVAARDAERAHAFASRLRSTFPPGVVQVADGWPPSRGAATLLVNATPVSGEALVEPEAGLTVVDLAYNADGSPTELVRAAREADATVVDGLDVLVAQGAASFERWTGVQAPRDVMLAALRSLRP
jgi:shikimate dehydrogenase